MAGTARGGRNAPATGSRFATTQWSLILSARERSSPDADEALATLCSLYWYPIYSFVRRRGRSADEAQDLTQGFFARILEKDELRAVDRSRGRFRSFLLTACQHFLSNERDRVQATKRGGGRVVVPIDVATAERRYAQALSHSETPERLFERQWALTLLGGALDGLKDAYSAAGKLRLFERLKGFLHGEDGPGAEGAARDLGMTEGAVKVATHRLRRRYREALRRRIAETVETPEQIEDEVRYLLQVLGPSTERL